MKINNFNASLSTGPYPYTIVKDFIDSRQAISILNWLENADWNLTVMDFYSQYEFMLDETNVPNDLRFLISEETINNMRTLMMNVFSCGLRERCHVVAHKLVSSQVIKIHNDFLDEEDVETHRLLIQFNREWNEENGGFLMIFNSNNPSDIHEVILPHHSSAFAFEISRESFHAVSEIKSGERYTLIYNFIRE